MTRASVDVSRCQGHGRCLLEAPELFDVGDNGKVELLDAGELSAPRAEELDAAVLACPEAAIRRVD